MFFFSVLIYWITLTYFHMLNHPFISGGELRWMIYFMYAWIQFVNILRSNFGRQLGLQFFLLNLHVVWLLG